MAESFRLRIYNELPRFVQDRPLLGMELKGALGGGKQLGDCGDFSPSGETNPPSCGARWNSEIGF